MSPSVNCVEFRSHSLKPTDECWYKVLFLTKSWHTNNNLLMWSVKIALALRSIYLACNQIALQARINFFGALVLSQLEFSAFFQSLPLYSIDKINKKLDGALDFAFFWTNYDSAHKLLLENKLVSAKFQIAKFSVNRLFDIIQQTNIQDQRNSE